MQKSGILYICPTPIGNLEDITLRAIRILKEVDFIACEDTRVTQKLLNHYNISTKLISYHKFSEKEKSEYLIRLLNEGKNIALVSDAGTPLISDPGSEIVRQAHENKIKVEPLPGPSAVITALSASYLIKPDFIFLGFLPKSINEKEEIIAKYGDINIVIYESPNRLVKTLEEIQKILGNRNATIARELTKIYEEINRRPLEDHIKYYSENPPKGEIVIIIEGAEKAVSYDEAEIKDKIRKLKIAGYSTKEISKILSTLSEWPKSKIYDFALEQK